LPTGQALAVFGLLGLGMALPYLAASAWPALAHRLPRPGAWMNTFRQLMAFPMFATVVWLLWVLGQQSGIDGVAALLLLLVLLTLLIWSLGLQGRARWALGGLALVSLLWATGSLGPQVVQLTTPSIDTGVADSTGEARWQVWSPQRQAEHLAEGRPVFVDFTAAWCVTCQYNKRTTLSDPALLADMARHNVALLRADWTRRDPVITAELSRLGRNGVPVYAIHRPGAPALVLSEVLTVKEVRQALGAGS
jgi:thiol:disulfide interchange protein DsbD